MPEKKDAIKEKREQQPEVQAPASPQSTPSSSMPVLLASLALLLAAFALAATLISNKNMGSRDDIQGKLNVIESRMDQMEALMATNKRDLVQAELKKMLLNLRALSHLGDNETKSEITKAEAILQRLSSRETKVEAKVDLKSTEQAVELEKTKAPAAASASSKPAEESVIQGSPDMQTPDQASPEDKTETETAPATIPVPTEEKTALQGEATPADTSGTVPETAPTAPEPDSSTAPANAQPGSAPETAGNAVPGNPVETANQPAHEEPEASQAKAPSK